MYAPLTSQQDVAGRSVLRDVYLREWRQCLRVRKTSQHTQCKDCSWSCLDMMNVSMSLESSMDAHAHNMYLVIACFSHRVIKATKPLREQFSWYAFNMLGQLLA